MGAVVNPLDRIAETTRALREVQDAKRQLVKRLREDGTTWQEIADALGVSRQAAWRKYREK